LRKKENFGRQWGKGEREMNVRVVLGKGREKAEAEESAQEKATLQSVVPGKVMEKAEAENSAMAVWEKAMLDKALADSLMVVRPEMPPQYMPEVQKSFLTAFVSWEYRSYSTHSI
ncbi:hypothetical protein RUND412_010871, partial [Rhizina undulata]